MPFSARAFRVLIASPSDVARERELAVEVIQEWNDANSKDRQVILLPVRWETHAAPEYNQRPQSVINRQFADHADLVVGIFWTKIGTPTGEAESGTIEGITRAEAAGKLVMLYFSSAPHDPGTLDLDQLRALQEFKKRAWKKALVSTYTDVVHFKQNFSRQLDIHARSLLAGQGEGAANEQPHLLQETSIELHFGDVDAGRSLGARITRTTGALEVTDFATLPDYEAEDKQVRTSTSGSAWFGLSEVNKDYYREYATHLVLTNFFTPIDWWLKNIGGIGARDVYVDLELSTEEDVLVVCNQDAVPKAEPRTKNGTGLLSRSFHPNTPDALIKPSKVWQTHVEIRALQPQREVVAAGNIVVGATSSCQVKIAATIYADTLSRPLKRSLVLDLEVKAGTTNSAQIIAHAKKRQMALE